MRDLETQKSGHEQEKNISRQTGKIAAAAAETTGLRDSNSTVTKRCLLLGCWIVLSSLLFRSPLIALVRMSLSSDDASYLVLIPFISAWLLFMESHNISRDVSYDRVIGGSFLLLAGCAALASRLAGGASSLGLQLPGYILSLVLVWVAGFALLFGKTASKTAYFPLLFLLLMVPLPRFLLDQVIHLLQAGSAWITGGFFDLFGVPALREGLVFHLARVNIEIAEECSGIRSSMALLILALLVAHFRLTRFWNKTLFIAFGLFMMILKNGIRIATLTLLAVYVEPSFLTGKLHHEGGIVFFVLALLLLWPVLVLLQRWESGRPMAGEPAKTL
jgi:exosortase